LEGVLQEQSKGAEIAGTVVTTVLTIVLLAPIVAIGSGWTFRLFGWAAGL
jgi:hypothetical protein